MQIHLIYIYLNRGGLYALEKMKEKHEYFIDDALVNSFKKFPIFTLWEIELDLKESLVRKTINEMYDSSKPENPNKKDTNEINSIISIYLNRDLTKSRTRTNFKNKILKIDTKSSVIKIIDDFSNLFKNKNVDLITINKELDSLKNKLQRIING